jgi:predicted kinase
MTKPKLISMVGLPRSGKSTICKKLSKELGAPIVNRDAIRLALHGQRYQALAEPMIKAISLIMIRSLFGAGHQVVINDETNYSRASRDYSRDDANWDTYFYWVKTSPEICKERAEATGQPDLFPVIDDMHKRWETFTPKDVLWNGPTYNVKTEHNEQTAGYAGDPGDINFGGSDFPNG